MNKNKKLLLPVAAAGFVLIIILMLTVETSITVGVNWHYRKIRMPLYVKWTEFLARHYEYERLSKEITAGCKTDEEKTLAILKWTRENLRDLPQGMPLHDDHILNIIIRGYAVPEQFQDVFTTLCAYGNIDAFFKRVYDKSHKARYTVSLVKLGGKWRVFDAYHNLYFRTRSGEIAGIEDIIKDPSIVSGKDVDALTVDGVPYKEFFHDLSGISEPQTTRPEKQMPLHRIIYETKRALKLEKDDDRNANR